MEGTMMDMKKKVNQWSLIALSCSALLLGCGSDGKDGKDGPDGVIGVSITDTPSVMAQFTQASVEDGQVSVTFKLENANGVAVLGLTKDYDLR